jgi:2-iminobutanoate/2-iminopropanoate deaminase
MDWVKISKYVGGVTRMREVISTDRAPEAVGPYSQAVTFNNFVFVSGQVAIDPATGQMFRGTVAEQTELALKNLSELLWESNSSLEMVLKCNVYMTDLKYFNEMNEVYKKYFHKDYPARLTVAVSEIYGGLSVEIDCIAGIEKYSLH